MKLFKLTAFSTLLFAALITLGSCEKEAEIKKSSRYEKTGIPVNGAQETPANPATATGTLDVLYIRGSGSLQYKVTWTGLTTNPSAMHIHGLAPIGFPAGIVQNILTAPNPTGFPASGSYSGTLLVDGVHIKEENLLAGLYYINIHTAAYPAGEIRGQIRFQ